MCSKSAPIKQSSSFLSKKIVLPPKSAPINLASSNFIYLIASLTKRDHKNWSEYKKLTWVFGSKWIWNGGALNFFLLHVVIARVKVLFLAGQFLH